MGSGPVAQRVRMNIPDPVRKLAEGLSTRAECVRIQ